MQARHEHKVRRAHRPHHGDNDRPPARGGEADGVSSACAMSPRAALRASATTHHSLLDGALQVVVNVIVQQRVLCWTPGSGFRWRAKHDLARLWHNIAVTYMLVECHSGYDVPWAMHRVVPGVLGGAPAHEQHHARGDVCFAQFSTYLDYAFGTGQRSKMA